MGTIAVKEDEHCLSAAFKAVIIYDDVSCAARAAVSLERTRLGSDEAITWDIKSWRLDVLRQPTQAVITLAVAADANLIVFALNGAALPLEELLNWLEHWAANRRNEDAAVTLFGSEVDALLQNELARFARRRGLVYWDEGGAWNDEPPTAKMRPQMPEEPPDAQKLRLLAEAAPAPGHWGINE